MDADIAIIGFGPTGATLAGLLAKRGVTVVVVEKEAGVFPQPRAAHVDHTGLRTVQELGCLDALLPDMVRNRSLDFVDAQHDLLLRVPADQDSASNLPTSVYFYQPDFDRALRQTVSSMPGVRCLLGWELHDIDSSDTAVKLHLRAKGEVKTLNVGLVVGCDGATSTVRELLGIELESLNFDERWFVMDLKFERLPPNLPHDRVLQVCDPRRPHLTTPISATRQRFEFMLLEGDDPGHAVTQDFVREQLVSWLGDTPYEIERSAVYTFHGLVARDWRRGRVLIAGDAAHQMPPFLGQGMCSGLRDASNLAWKLALVVQSRAELNILDTYQSERSAHVKKITEAAVGFGKLVCITDPAAAKARNEQLRSNQGLGDRAAAFALPKLETGPLVWTGGGGLFIQPTTCGVRFDDEVGPHFAVVSRSRAALGKSAEWWADEFEAHVVVLSEDPRPEFLKWMNRYDADVCVVRPDRYVLWRGRNLDDITELMGLLRTGSPRLTAQEVESAP